MDKRSATARYGRQPEGWPQGMSPQRTELVARRTVEMLLLDLGSWGVSQTGEYAQDANVTSKQVLGR
jgi:hypothetical protein